MPRLRHVDCSEAGFVRRRQGRGFSYSDARRRPLPADEVERIKALSIPPAWTDVWICKHPNGHLQAVGTDAAGRRQYLYLDPHSGRRRRSPRRPGSPGASPASSR